MKIKYDVKKITTKYRRQIERVTKVHFSLPFLSTKSFKVFYIVVNFCAIRLCHGKEQLEKIEVRDNRTPPPIGLPTWFFYVANSVATSRLQRSSCLNNTLHWLL